MTYATTLIVPMTAANALLITGTAISANDGTDLSATATVVLTDMNVAVKPAELVRIRVSGVPTTFDGGWVTLTGASATLAQVGFARPGQLVLPPAVPITSGIQFTVQLKDFLVSASTFTAQLVGLGPLGTVSQAVTVVAQAEPTPGEYFVVLQGIVRDHTTVPQAGPVYPLTLRLSASGADRDVQLLMHDARADQPGQRMELPLAGDLFVPVTPWAGISALAGQAVVAINDSGSSVPCGTLLQIGSTGAWHIQVASGTIPAAGRYFLTTTTGTPNLLPIALELVQAGGMVNANVVQVEGSGTIDGRSIFDVLTWMAAVLLGTTNTGGTAFVSIDGLNQPRVSATINSITHDRTSVTLHPVP